MRYFGSGITRSRRLFSWRSKQASRIVSGLSAILLRRRARHRARPTLCQGPPARRLTLLRWRRVRPRIRPRRHGPAVPVPRDPIYDVPSHRVTSRHNRKSRCAERSRAARRFRPLPTSSRAICPKNIALSWIRLVTKTGPRGRRAPNNRRHPKSSASARHPSDAPPWQPSTKRWRPMPGPSWPPQDARQRKSKLATPRHPPRRKRRVPAAPQRRCRLCSLRRSSRSRPSSSRATRSSARRPSDHVVTSSSSVFCIAFPRYPWRKSSASMYPAEPLRTPSFCGSGRR
jgi:hypothetical protein